MAVPFPPRQERLEARVTREQKELLQHAASLQGTTLSEFLVRSAQRAAEQSIRDHAVLDLTARETQSFVEALLDAPAPNPALRAAAEHYRKVTFSA